MSSNLRKRGLSLREKRHAGFFDFNLISQRDFLDHYRRHGNPNTWWWPHWADPDVFRPFDEPELYHVGTLGQMGQGYEDRRRLWEAIRQRFRTPEATGGFWFALLEAARRNPEAFLGGDQPLTVDEAQKCPELLPVIRRLVDRERVPGRFLLSGSANFALLKEITESLAARAVYLTFHPFTGREIAGRLGEEPFSLWFFRTLELPPGGAAAPPRRRRRRCCGAACRRCA